MITNEKAMELLKEAGVLLEGHFLLTSGRHSEGCGLSSTRM